MHESISLKKLASQPFVAFQQDIPTRQALDEILRKHGVSLTTNAEFDNIELIKRAVEIGLGIAVVPSMTVKSEIQAGLLKALFLAEGPFLRPIAVVHRRRRSLAPAAKKMKLPAPRGGVSFKIISTARNFCAGFFVLVSKPLPHTPH